MTLRVRSHQDILCICQEWKYSIFSCKSRQLLGPCCIPVQSRVEGHLLLDPTADEAYEEDGALLLAYMPQASLVSLSRMLTDASLLLLRFTGDFTNDKC